jgi:hypothetical protein
LKRVADEQKKVTDAWFEAEKAKLDFMKGHGEISPEKYAQSMAVLDAWKQNRKDDADAGLSEKSIGVLVNALNNIDLQQHLTAPQLAGANQKAEELKKSLESLKATIETNRKLLEAHIGKLTGGKEGKDGLVPMLNQISGDDQDIAQQFINAGILNPNKDQVREAGFNKKGAFSYTDPSEIKKAIQLIQKINEERGGEAGNAGTIRGLTEKLPGTESSATTAAAEVKALEQKLHQLETDKKAVQEELDKRRGEDQAKTDSAGAIAGAKTVAGAFKSETVKQPGGAAHHLTALAEAQHQIEENHKVIAGLQSALAQALAQGGNSALSQSIVKAIQDLITRDNALAAQINVLSGVK